MDSSQHNNSADVFDTSTELKFEQGSVSQKFAVNDGKRRNQSILIPGKLYITESERFGEYLEWKPIENPSPGSTPSPYSKPLIAELHGSAAGFRKDNDHETVEFIPDPRMTEYLRPIKVELSELRSYMMVGKNELIFIHSDGTTLNPFVFERSPPDNFIAALERCIGITKSKHTKNLFMFGPKRNDESPNVSDIQSVVAELFPDQVNQFNNIWGFVKDFKNDPYAGACTIAAKLGHVATNGELPGGHHIFHVPKPNNDDSKESSPWRTTNGEQQHNQSFHSDGMDADYTTNEEGYEVIFKPERPSFELPSRPETFRGQPLSQEQWLNYLDNEGRISNMEEIRKIIFQGGVEPSIRTHVWPFLLGVYDSHSTYEERRQIFIEKTCSYNRIKHQWATITEDQEERFHAFRDFKSLIDKDVSRTDRTLDFFKGDNSKGTDNLKTILMTYMFYNFNLGYVQGMSDILAPLLMEIQDEIMTFWLFVKFMEKIDSNFEMSQEGMQKQLKDSYTLLALVDPRLGAYLDACDASNMYFGFRWLLIWFKREFSYPDVMILWESLWTGMPGPNYPLFVGLSILIQHRSTVMENKFGLSEILRHVNDLSMRIDLEVTLALAESLYRQVLAAEAKLPNSIRTIIGLPEVEEEKEEPVIQTAGNNLGVAQGPSGDSYNNSFSSASSNGSRKRRSTSPRPGTAVEVVNTIPGNDNLIVPNGNAVSESSTTASPDVETLENQYEIGVSQFM